MVDAGHEKHVRFLKTEPPPLLLPQGSAGAKDRQPSLNMGDKPAEYSYNVAMLFSNAQWKYLQNCYRFSDRQMQILKLLFAGLDSDRIAKKLKIRYNTVKAHFGKIYKRVGVQSKTEMVMQLFEVAQSHNKNRRR